MGICNQVRAITDSDYPIPDHNPAMCMFKRYSKRYRYFYVDIKKILIDI